VADRTIEYIERAEEPFFIWCGINDPHHSFKPPGPYWDMFDAEDMPPPVRREGELEDKPPHFRGFYEGRYRELDTDGFLLGSDPYLTDKRVRLIRAAYYGMVALIDDNVARMLEALERKGLRQNTVIIYVSDHGEFLGDHGFVCKGPMHYENVLRVPFVWNGPGYLASGHTVGGLAGLIDLFPTILNLAGVSIPAGTQGRTLIRQLVGASERAHDQLYIENDVDTLGLRLRTLVTERWKLTWYAGQDYGEIYDLETDPYEFVNLWERCDPAVKHDLVSRLLETVLTNQDTLPPKISHA
jgi:arylsulfatase A-like enzyme